MEKKCDIEEFVDLRRMMSCEVFEARVEDIEPEHQDLPHLGKRSRESPPASDESMPNEERLMIAGAHMIPPCNLALMLGVLVPKIVINT